MLLIIQLKLFEFSPSLNALTEDMQMKNSIISIWGAYISPGRATPIPHLNIKG